jgi:hypothetical protein
MRGSQKTVDVMKPLDIILMELGEVYKNAHDIAMRTSHPKALEICRIASELAMQLTTLKKSLANTGESREV